MKQSFFYLMSAFIIMMSSCSNESESESEFGISPKSKIPVIGEGVIIDFMNMHDGDKMLILYTEDEGKTYMADYQATKIGEYLWMDSNFKDPEENNQEVTQHQINKCLDIYRIDTMAYTITVSEFNKYFGQYYSRDMIERMDRVGNMHESPAGVDNGKWKLPSAAAFRQLFAMCGDASERAVRTTLCYKVGEIPIMRESKNTFWIDRGNTNKYGFNLVYSGGRCHNDEFPWGTCHGPGDCYEYLGNRGDLYTFYGAVMYPADNGVTAKIHDYPDTRDSKIWAWLPVRWCRRLTPQELGYELFVNKERTDIQKLEADATPPSGYEVLPDGYLRGFYVQYILNNPNPSVTVSQLREMEKNLEEVRRGTPLT